MRVVTVALVVVMVVIVAVLTVDMFWYIVVAAG